MTTTTQATTITKASQQQANTMVAHDNENDPFEIKQELRHAPRPRLGHTSNIVEFYRGRSVFITGASGFIGKVLIEKLLRTCPSIKRVFVLIRPKYNKQPHERLRELLDSPLFDGLREDGQQKLEQKVCLVEGDVTQTNLGLSSYDLARIVDEVSVLFHSAATVKFDEPLKQSIAINITGTKNMINVCRCIPQLAGVVHVSTAYANCDLDSIDEHIYPVDMDPERLIQLADWLDKDTLQELKHRFLGAKPNTYTYTKSLAEWLLVRSARDLPVVICRPSIVVATASEPFKGWIDNMNGPTGVVLGAGKGLIRTMYAENEFLADLVPVDKVINLIVTLGWFAHLNKSQRNKLHGGSGGALGESLADSLIISSSGFSSLSGAGSSAASTSGVDDSLQEDELQVEASPHRQDDDNDDDNDDDLHDHPDDHHQVVHHHPLCAESHRSHHNHDRHLRHRQQQQAPQQQQHHRRTSNADAGSSPEDDGADLSISSESSSSMMAEGSERNVCQMNEEDGLYSFQRDEHHDDEHLTMQQPDDGYASRSPEYANSIASSDSSESRRRRSPDNGKRASVALGNGNGGGMKKSTTKPILSTSEIEQTCSTARRRDDASEAADNHQQEQRPAPNSEEVAVKLRKFRARTLAKLADKELAEELADVPVFHCTSGGENPISWGQVQLFILAALAVFPSSATYRYPCGSFTNNAKLDKFYALTLHYLPAYLLDFLTSLMGGKPLLVKIFKKFDQAASVLKAFTTKQWHFTYDNRLFLMQELMSDEDKRLFDFDMKSLEWCQFLRDYVIGVRKFLLKEPMSNLAAARRNLRFVYYRNLCLQLAFSAAGAYYAATKMGLLGRG